MKPYTYVQAALKARKVTSNSGTLQVLQIILGFNQLVSLR